VLDGAQLASRLGADRPWTDQDRSESPEPVQGWRVR
jgi:hypothetical protein